MKRQAMMMNGDSDIGGGGNDVEKQPVVMEGRITTSSSVGLSTRTTTKEMDERVRRRNMEEMSNNSNSNMMMVDCTSSRNDDGINAERKNHELLQAGMKTSTTLANNESYFNRNAFVLPIALSGMEPSGIRPQNIGLTVDTAAKDIQSTNNGNQKSPPPPSTFPTLSSLPTQANTLSSVGSLTTSVTSVFPFSFSKPGLPPPLDLSDMVSNIGNIPLDAQSCASSSSIAIEEKKPKTRKEKSLTMICTKFIQFYEDKLIVPLYL